MNIREAIQTMEDGLKAMSNADLAEALEHAAKQAIDSGDADATMAGMLWEYAAKRLRAAPKEPTEGALLHARASIKQACLFAAGDVATPDDDSVRWQSAFAMGVKAAEEAVAAVDLGAEVPVPEAFKRFLRALPDDDARAAAIYALGFCKDCGCDMREPGGDALPGVCFCRSKD